MERREGFTLLEVLAAVLILALVSASLTGSAYQFMNAEGRSERRLRASLLADEELASLEALVLLGQMPEAGESEREQDEFLVRIDVAPFDPAAEWLGPAGEAAAPARAGSLLTPGTRRPGAASPSPLRKIRVEVQWLEGFDELLVSRTSFAVDREAVTQLLQEAGLGPDSQAEQAEPTESSGREAR